MNVENEVITELGDSRLFFHCKGCGFDHAIGTGINHHKFNGDYENPTFHPSVLVTTPNPKKDRKCHSFVKDGMIQYLEDCTHDLAGKTVKLDRNPAWVSRFEIKKRRS